MGEMASSGLVNQPTGALSWVTVCRFPLDEKTVHVPFASVVQLSGSEWDAVKLTPAVPATALLLVLSPPAVKVIG